VSDFPEIGVTSERASELKELRERSQEQDQLRAAAEYEKGGASPAPSAELVDPSEKPLAIKDALDWIEDYNRDMAEAFPKKFRPVPKPLAFSWACTTIPVMNRLGIRMENAPTWALIAGSVMSGLMVFGPGLAIMWRESHQEAGAIEPTPEELEILRQLRERQKQKAQQQPQPAAGGKAA